MNAKFEQGLEVFRGLAGDAADQMIASLDTAAPGFSEALVVFAFVDVYGRPGLDLKTRELLTVAALAATGHAAPQLKLHIGGALKAGCTPAEIAETIVHISLYAGIPASLNGLAAAAEVFHTHPSTPSHPA